MMQFSIIMKNIWENTVTELPGMSCNHKYQNIQNNLSIKQHNEPTTSQNNIITLITMARNRKLLHYLLYF